MSQKQAKRQKKTNKRVGQDKYLTREADETVALLGFAPAARREEWRLYCELLMTVLLSVALFAAVITATIFVIGQSSSSIDNNDTGLTNYSNDCTSCSNCFHCPQCYW